MPSAGREVQSSAPFPGGKTGATRLALFYLADCSSKEVEKDENVRPTCIAEQINGGIRLLEFSKCCLNVHWSDFLFCLDAQMLRPPK